MFCRFVKTKTTNNVINNISNCYSVINHFKTWHNAVSESFISHIWVSKKKRFAIFFLDWNKLIYNISDKNNWTTFVFRV